MREYTAPELRGLLAASSEQPLLLDVREPWEYAICHIDGSTHVPMRQIPAALDGLDPARETVVICHHGNRSRHVGRYLEQAGFARIINLAGGVAGWARDVDPSMPTY